MASTRLEQSLNEWLSKRINFKEKYLATQKSRMEFTRDDLALLLSKNESGLYEHAQLFSMSACWVQALRLKEQWYREQIYCLLVHLDSNLIGIRSNLSGTMYAGYIMKRQA